MTQRPLRETLLEKVIFVVPIFFRARIKSVKRLRINRGLYGNRQTSSNRTIVNATYINVNNLCYIIFNQSRYLNFIIRSFHFK